MIKIGSAVLTEEGSVSRKTIAGIVRDVAELKRRGCQIVIVSSGAVAFGKESLGLRETPSLITEKQAVAALGQCHLISTYEEYFKKWGLLVGQVLLTHADLANRERYLNAKHALNTLLAYNAIPVINENDTVSVEEIKFGDNDRLSALCAVLIQADLLLLLSDVDGLYDKNPRVHEDAKRQTVVASVSDQILGLASGQGSDLGTGGMSSKLLAIRDVTRRGIRAIIADGKRPGVISSVFAGKELGTFFEATDDPITSRKHWIAYTLRSKGRLTVDAGAENALVAGGRSLLPVGIIGSEGDFSVGDAVTVVAGDGRELARGLSSYSSDEVVRIKGVKSNEIETILGYCSADAVIHRDDLVLL